MPPASAGASAGATRYLTRRGSDEGGNPAIPLCAVFLTGVRKKSLCWRRKRPACLRGPPSSRAAWCVRSNSGLLPRGAPPCWGTPWASLRTVGALRARARACWGGICARKTLSAETLLKMVRWIWVESHLRGCGPCHHATCHAWRRHLTPSRAPVWQDSDARGWRPCLGAGRGEAARDRPPVQPDGPRPHRAMQNALRPRKGMPRPPMQCVSPAMPIAPAPVARYALCSRLCVRRSQSDVSQTASKSSVHCGRSEAAAACKEARPPRRARLT